jgi:hypothetical protein
VFLLLNEMAGNDKCLCIFYSQFADMKNGGLKLTGSIKKERAAPA